MITKQSASTFGKSRWVSVVCLSYEHAKGGVESLDLVGLCENMHKRAWSCEQFGCRYRIQGGKHVVFEVVACGPSTRESDSKCGCSRWLNGSAWILRVPKKSGRENAKDRDSVRNLDDWMGEWYQKRMLNTEFFQPYIPVTQILTLGPAQMDRLQAEYSNAEYELVPKVFLIQDICSKPVCVEVKPKSAVPYSHYGSPARLLKEMGVPDNLMTSDFCSAYAKATHRTLKQIEKLSKGCTSLLSEYNPADLYSCDEVRTKSAVVALLASPQNNIRVFIKGETFVMGNDGQENEGATTRALKEARVLTDSQSVSSVLSKRLVDHGDLLARIEMFQFANHHSVCCIETILNSVLPEIHEAHSLLEGLWECSIDELLDAGHCLSDRACCTSRPLRARLLSLALFSTSRVMMDLSIMLAFDSTSSSHLYLLDVYPLKSLEKVRRYVQHEKSLAELFHSIYQVRGPASQTSFCTL